MMNGGGIKAMKNVSWVLLILHFVVPFLLLVTKHTKRAPAAIRRSSSSNPASMIPFATRWLTPPRSCSSSRGRICPAAA